MIWSETIQSETKKISNTQTNTTGLSGNLYIQKINRRMMCRDNLIAR